MTANTPVQTGTDAGAVSHEKMDWDSIDWNAAHQNVRRLQMRIEKRDEGEEMGQGESLATALNPLV